MLRMALVLGSVVLVLGGCNDPAAEMATAPPADGLAAAEPEMFTADPAGEFVAEAPVAVYQPVATAPPPAPTEPSRVTARSHRVAPGDTLYALARTYYSDGRRWKEIYEANRGRISNPDDLRLDQVLLIP